MKAKRIFDVVAAGFGLIVSSPVLVVAGLAVKLTSKGPVLHRAERIGRHGRGFTLLKLRTMLLHTEDLGGVTVGGDPRITRVGRWLRRFKVDELPQLINVLRGEMSLVGPRPEDPRYIAGYTEDQRRVLSVSPGITSPASIAYRDEERVIGAYPGDPISYYREVLLPAKLEIELAYLETRTFWSDIHVLMRTAFGLLTSPRRNAG